METNSPSKFIHRFTHQNKKPLIIGLSEVWLCGPGRNRTYISSSGNLHTIHCTTEPWKVGKDNALIQFLISIT